MAESFFFYDLETSGFNPRSARIMQFAGQRTSLDLKPIGKPVNTLIKLSEDVLPDPQAILVTGITPQQTIQTGLTEAAFLKVFEKEVATPGTIFVGYNTVRFDDEFMRFLHYRNFYDPYEWEWQDGKSRWDLLDVVRMTRALRPEGIKWPFDGDGRPTNRLELMTAMNKLEHSEAHDALSDVKATIALAQLIRAKQPKLFDYLLKLRAKNEVSKLVHTGQPFVYTSGKYPGEFEKTTIVATMADHPARQGVLVYDLRFDPEPFIDMSAARLAEAWKYKRDSDELQLPIKTLQFNRCPAVAPLSVLSQTSAKQLKHLQLDLKQVETNRQKLEKVKHWPDRILEALKLMDVVQEKRYAAHPPDVDGQLYDGFFSDADRRAAVTVRGTDPQKLQTLAGTIRDRRLKKLLLLYKARNFPEKLSDEEYRAWQDHLANKLLSGDEESRLAQYESRIQDVIADGGLTKHQEKILQDLQSWGEQVMAESGGA